MRLKKGSKVEVLKKTKAPSGSWWCAEIISGNGHNYFVRYLQSPDTIAAERISRKAIRPLPPPGVVENWVPGDIVELFDSNSWKAAEISAVLDGNYFFVRLCGSSQVLRVHKKNLRVRQIWKENKWFVVRKDAFGDGKLRRSTRANYNQTSNRRMSNPNVKVGDETEDRTGFDLKKTLQMVSPRRSGKRGLHTCLSARQTTAEPGHKILRVMENEGGLQRLIPPSQSSVLDKVDVVVSPLAVLGKTHTHATSNKGAMGFSKTDVEKSRNLNAEHASFPQSSLAPLDYADSRASSVASCSSTPSDDPYNIHHVYNTGDSNTLDDADSSCSERWRHGRVMSSHKNKEATEIHKPELDTYCFTMDALYASGPLSWEQQEMLTNFRIRLHITNDEHLSKLRSLVYAKKQK